jgi:putative oxygen-independent coproporphyrinogen III oxidase
LRVGIGGASSSPSGRDGPSNGLPPLGVYIHWPYCARICPYCDFTVVRDRGRLEEQRALVAAIADDLAGHAALTGRRRLSSIFFGGGTPSLMDPAWAADLIHAACALWAPEPDLEISLEANPTDAETRRFAALAQAGVNRLSLGLQALDDRALALLGRNHDAEDGRRAAKIAALAVSRLSLDLIYALPGQDAAGWTQTLRQAVDLGAEHISPYQLTIESGTPFDRAVRRGRFTPADPDLAADLYESTQDVLESLGFSAYEVSNHAKGDAARARHNLIYWRGHDYVGVGPGAHGRLPGDSPGARSAIEADATVTGYIRRVAETGRGWSTVETLSPVQAAEERLLMGLRVADGVPLADLLALPRLNPAPFIDQGLLRLQGERLAATPNGRLVLDRLTLELLR